MAARESARQCSPAERSDAASRKPVDIVPIVRPLPQYPRITEPPHYTLVRLFVAVKRSGAVRDICVLETRPPKSVFEAAAVESVRQWRYAPEDVKRLPPDRRIVVDVEFVLSDR